MIDETVNPIPQDAPKPNGNQPETRPSTLTPVQAAAVKMMEQPPVQPDLSKSASLGLPQQPSPPGLIEKVAMATGLVPDQRPVQPVTELPPKVVAERAQLGQSIAGYLEGQSNTVTAEVAKTVISGMEGANRAAVNIFGTAFPGVTERLINKRDPNTGQPLSKLSTDPGDFVVSPQTAVGKFVGEMVTQGILSYVLGTAGGAALGSLGKGGAAASKAFDFGQNKTKLGRIAAFMNVNGAENIVQRLWETRADGVQDVRWWARTLGIEEQLPEVLASGKDLNVLQQAASDYLAGATAGSLAGAALMGVVKIGLGSIGKSIEAAMDNFGGPPKGSQERARLVLAYEQADYDTQLGDGIEEVLNSPMRMDEAPPSAAGASGGVPPTPPPAPSAATPGGAPTPIFRVTGIDEQAAKDAQQRIAERLPSERSAVVDIGELQRRRSTPGSIVETEEGALLGREALDVPIAMQKQLLEESVRANLQKLDDPKSEFDPAVRQQLYQDILTSFAYEWTRLVDTHFSKVQFDPKTTANEILGELSRLQLPMSISSSTAENDVFELIAVKAMYDTFEKVFAASAPDKQGTIIRAIQEIRSIRNASAGSATEVLTDITKSALASTAKGADNMAPVVAQAITEMTLARQNIVEIVRSLVRLAPDGNINHLSAEQKADAVRTILRAFNTGLRLRQAVSTGPVAKFGGVDQLVNEAVLRRAQNTPPTIRETVEGSRDIPSRKVEQLTGAYERMPEQRGALQGATATPSGAAPTEMPPPPAPGEGLVPRKVVNVEEDSVVLSGGMATGVEPYGVSTEFGGSGTVLSELASQKETLSQTLLALIRSGVLDADDTRAALNQARAANKDNPDVTEFLQSVFNDEQSTRLETLVFLSEVLRKRGSGGPLSKNPLSRSYLSDLPTPAEIADMAKMNAQRRMAEGRFRSTPEEQAQMSPDMLLRRETELDIISIERELLNMSEGDVRTNQVASDISIKDPTPGWERRLNRILGGYSKAHLAFSSINVASANTLQYMAEAISAGAHALLRYFDNSPGQLAANYRAKMMWKTLLPHMMKTLGIKESGMVDVLKTGRSSVFRDESRAKELLSKVETARSHVVNEDATVLDNPNILLEGVGVTIPSRTVPMVDELFRLRIYETEFKTGVVHQWLNVNASSDIEAAARAADKAWDEFASGALAKTEAEALKSAAAKVDSLGIFRDANGKVKDPITYAAAVERQYWDDIRKSFRMVDDSKIDTIEGMQSGFDAVNAPDFLLKLNKQIQYYIGHMAAANTPEGLAGSIAEAMVGKDLPVPLRVLLRLTTLFPVTVVNEAFKAVDYAGAFPGWAGKRAFDIMDARMHRSTQATRRAARRKEDIKSIFYTRRELASTDKMARKRAEARVLFSGLMYVGFLTWYYSRKSEKVLTVESATGATATPPKPGDEVQLPTVEKAAFPILQEQGSQTSKKARRITEQRRGDIAGMEVPILSPVMNIFELMMGTLESGGRKLSKGLGYEATKRIVEVMGENIELAEPQDEKLMDIVLDVADILGAKDVVDSLMDSPANAGNVLAEFISKISMIPLGGFSIYGLLAEMQSGHRLESRDATPFGTGKIPVWQGAGSTSSNILRFMGRKGREKRDITGAKKLLPADRAEMFLPKVLAKIFNVNSEYELDIGNGKSRAANQSLAMLLAQKGYPVPYLNKNINDPDPSRNRGQLDLSKFIMGDDRDAYSHLLDLFMYGDKEAPALDPMTQSSTRGFVGGKRNMTLIEYLNLMMAPEAFSGLDVQPEIGSPQSPIPTRPLNYPDTTAEKYAQRLQSALTDRRDAAIQMLLNRSDDDKKNNKTSKSIRADWLDLATGGIK